MDGVPSYISSHVRATHKSSHLLEHLPLRRVASVEHDLSVRSDSGFRGVLALGDESYEF